MQNVIATPTNNDGRLSRVQNPSHNNITGMSVPNQILDMQQSYYDMKTQPNNIHASVTVAGTSSNQKHASAIGGNGQISPVSINSIAFTENDNKLSIGSYDPSHLSSFGGPS